MTVDRLDNVLGHFSASTDLINTNALCGLIEERAIPGKGHLHIIRRGLAEVRHEQLPVLHVVEPTLLFYPRPLTHWFLTDEQSGADFVCATVSFSAGSHPILRALPPLVAMPLAGMPEMHATLDLLFAEISGQRYGRQTTANRLLEVLLVQLLRKIVDDGMMSTGMLAGLAHPQLGKALIALHDAPAFPWTLKRLAAIAGMSRSCFANIFKTTLGSTAGEYICEWRLGLAQELLRRDTPLKHVAAEVGYGSPIALTRVFKAHLGMSPRVWARSEQLASRAGMRGSNAG